MTRFVRSEIHVNERSLSFVDQEWLDAVNAERKHDQLDKVSYDAFEIIMDRIEKEWFDLVRPS